MPYKKIMRGKNKGKYISPKGNVISGKQLKAYYATDGWSKKSKRK